MIDTARDQSSPRIKQLSFFLPNRVGALLSVVRRLESNNIHICAISILDSADHAVIRLVVDRPSLALKALHDEGIQVFEVELLGVELPQQLKVGIRKILAALLLAEVNVRYVYSLIAHADHRPVLALNVDDIPSAIKVLRNHGLTLIGQEEINWDYDNA
jgi:hypothetical protein